ncbi:MAG TPA: hypothetical protein VFZ16_17515 [Hyphomicrobiaceae bacterium]|nr:hypothetical protein [Hyphomicrobiaceae bacterium]
MLATNADGTTTLMTPRAARRLRHRQRRGFTRTDGSTGTAATVSLISDLGGYIVNRIVT